MKGVTLVDRKPKNPQLIEPTISNLSQAIFTVNRHAKTAPNPKQLYTLKHEALKKMIKEGKAKKVGLHFSQNPRNSQQRSDVLVVCDQYTFHIPPIKTDFIELPHLGKLDESIRNPKSTLSLNLAKTLLQTYTGIKDPDQSKNKPHKPFNKPVFKKLGESY
ncbi:YkyB family protein [Bacillus sp. CGMCC 1.16607]|uniref:YkyB family protein n=1 Tax=Bacillus sp. CGMCC 1.16607 TaxID=3351842 RepID=UPI00363C2090